VLLLGLVVSFPLHARDAFPAYSANDLQKLIALADAMLEEHEAQENEVRAQQHKPFNTMTFAELKAHFSEPPGYISSRERRGWVHVRRLAEEALANPYKAAANDLPEVLEAIQNNHHPPAPPWVHFLMPPILAWDYLHNPIGRGELLAANIDYNPNELDVSKLDPVPSTFWERPASITSQDLHAGFGRAALPRYETNLWEYAAPKTSWGTWPGFELRCGKLEIKAKLAETRSEHFNARIFHALGFHADPTDHVPYLKISYSRRLFREFHLRKDLTIDIRAPALGLRLYTYDFQRRYDPFRFIAEAVLKDGRRLTGNELKHFLLRNSEKTFPEDDPSNFLPENEAQVDYLVTTAANVQLKDRPFKPIGPWRFEGLGHEHLRELRGAGLLAAWLGWNDSRFENTRLKVREVNGQWRLAHFFNDLGSGLGESEGVIPRPLESPERFPSTFTAPRIVRGKGRMTTPFRIRHFQPIDDTGAFEQMTMDDARWMARLIAQLTEEQIVQALTASGFTSADVRTYTEKLISRRDRMLRDLELQSDSAFALGE
jgi:hypothetical protein